MVFHWSLSDSKSSHVSRTVLGIPTDLYSIVVSMVSARPLTSKSSSTFQNLLVTESIEPIAVVTFMFQSFFFQFPSKVEVFILLFTFFHFYSVFSRNNKVHNFAISLFFFFDYCMVWSSGRDLVIRLYLKIPVEFVRVILQDRCWVVYLFVLHFLHNSQWVTLPIQSCLELYSFCANLLHSLIM